MYLNNYCFSSGKYTFLWRNFAVWFGRSATKFHEFDAWVVLSIPGLEQLHCLTGCVVVSAVLEKGDIIIYCIQLFAKLTVALNFNNLQNGTVSFSPCPDGTPNCSFPRMHWKLLENVCIFICSDLSICLLMWKWVLAINHILLCCSKIQLWKILGSLR